MSVHAAPVLYSAACPVWCLRVWLTLCSALRTASFHRFGVTCPNNSKWAQSQDNVKIAFNHPILGENFPVFDMIDVAHQVKSVCNALERKGARELTMRWAADGQFYALSLERVKAAYDEEVERLKREDRVQMGVEVPLVRKLSPKHFDRGPWAKMNVAMAAQLLSQTVADHFQHSNPALSWYCGMWNNILDIFNGHKSA